jgi:hypothetical protein
VTAVCVVLEERFFKIDLLFLCQFKVLLMFALYSATFDPATTSSFLNKGIPFPLAYRCITGKHERFHRALYRFVSEHNHS